MLTLEGMSFNHNFFKALSSSVSISSISNLFWRNVYEEFTKNRPAAFGIHLCLSSLPWNETAEPLPVTTANLALLLSLHQLALLFMTASTSNYFPLIWEHGIVN
jgi:hypothetical protein